jgi:hypothetical protein
LVRFGFFDKNRFDSVFFCLAQFFQFGFGSVWFFRFQAYKTKTEPVGFFKILISLIGFFYGSVFFYFFSDFLDLIGFLLATTFLSFHLTNLKTHVYVSYLLGYFNLVFPNKKNKHIKDKFISV